MFLSLFEQPLTRYYCTFCAGLVQTPAHHEVDNDTFEAFKQLESLQGHKFGIGAPYCCRHLEPHEHDGWIVDTNSMEDIEDDILCMDSCPPGVIREPERSSEELHRRSMTGDFDDALSTSDTSSNRTQYLSVYHNCFFFLTMRSASFEKAD